MINWVDGPIFRRSILGVGLVLLVIYGLMLIPVGVNLPASWAGLIYAGIGLTGSVCAVAYFKYGKRALLVPVGIAFLMTIVWAAAIVLFGEAIDRQLQADRQKRQSTGVTTDQR